MNDSELLTRIADSLFEILGQARVRSLKSSIVAKLDSLPNTVSITIQEISDAIIFTDFRVAAKAILDQPPPEFPAGNRNRRYGYKVMFTNGDEFERTDLSWPELQDLHRRLQSLVDHVETLAKRSQ